MESVTKLFALFFACLCLIKPVIASNNPASTNYVDNAVSAASPVAGSGLSKTNNVLSVSPFYTVGSLAQGGVVFFVESNGQHGLAVALSDLSSSYPWGTISAGSQPPTGAVNYALGNGYANTLLIIASQMSQYAGTGGVVGNYNFAAFQATTPTGGDCANNGNCVGGWYLPNQTELELVERALCGLSISGYTPLSFTRTYWTSQQAQDTTTSVDFAAVAVSFTNNSTCSPNANFVNTNTSYYVRPIRQF